MEEVRSAIQRNEENQEKQEKQAFMTKKKEKSDSELHQKPNYPTCRLGYHNPLTKHSEAECQNLKLGKPTTSLLCVINQQDIDSIILDSGASNSMFNNEKHFISFIPKEEEVILADGSSIKSLGSGTICIELSHFFLKINNCLLIPQLAIILLSMNTFIAANYSITKGISSKRFVVTTKDNKVIINGSFEIGNLIIHQNKVHAFKFSLSTPSTTVLHQLSGHPSLEYFKKMYPDKNISLFNFTTCNLSKMTKIPFKGTFPQPNCKLETIHMDLCGPISPESISVKKYFLRILDGFSHFIWIFFLTNKSECKDYIKNHINRVKQQANSKQSANFVEAIVLDPKSFSQETHHPDSKQWLEAINNELSNMKTHQVWSSHEQDKSIHPLTTTWVFKRKTDANGNLTKYKARLCVRGFNQREGIDYDDVFSQTGRLASLRPLLTLAHQHGFQIDQMDVQFAFLNGILDKTLYIFYPDGCKEESKILKLNKSLYVLKQSPRCWHNALINALLQMGLVPTKTDPCLYYSSDHNKPM
ncbi:hypothetical protein O181_037200 [Austropuccinia psidii MF-1]|uniref:Reverse transcriptase Ty1/copia-type domain-containing protein n=1 Tax=Austropuccinia psidii MF-1 TaxID=1389203 RepID=A0A9Q3HCW4_9BASI|nr:hypothetical protein [Austropuccinia psidii MF-1]